MGEVFQTNDVNVDRKSWALPMRATAANAPGGRRLSSLFLGKRGGGPRVVAFMQLWGVTLRYAGWLLGMRPGLGLPFFLLVTLFQRTSIMADPLATPLCNAVQAAPAALRLMIDMHIDTIPVVLQGHPYTIATNFRGSLADWVNLATAQSLEGTPIIVSLAKSLARTFTDATAMELMVQAAQTVVMARQQLPHLPGFSNSGTVVHFGRTWGALQDVEDDEEEDINTALIRTFLKLLGHPLPSLYTASMPS